VLVTILPYFVVRLSLTDSRQMRAFLVALLVISAGVALTLLFRLPVANLVGDRLRLGKANPIPVASLLSMGAVPALLLSVASRRRSLRVIGIAAFLANYSAIVLTGSRAALIACSISSLAFGILLLRRHRMKTLLLVGMAVCALAASVALAAPSSISRFDPRSWGRDESVALHLMVYREAARGFLSSPLVGVGPGSGMAENLILEVVRDYGAVGGFAFLAFLVGVAAQCWRAIRGRGSIQNHPLTCAAIAIVIGLLIEKQVSYSLTGSKDLFVFLAIVANSKHYALE